MGKRRENRKGKKNKIPSPEKKSARSILSRMNGLISEDLHTGFQMAVYLNPITATAGGIML